jgi:hypothetical protein
VNEKGFPDTNDELVRFVDADLSPERAARVERHVAECGACARELAELQTLAADIAAPLPARPLDVAAHVAGVMDRLDAPAPAAPKRPKRAWLGAALAVVAAAAVFALFVRAGEPDAPSERFVARSAGHAPSLERDVGVKLYADERPLRALSDGSELGAQTPVTASLRNVGREPAYLLLFAIDTSGEVHWLAPKYTVPGTNPEAPLIAPGTNERLLPTAVVFDDLAPGALRVVAVITRTPERVAAIEALAPAETVPERLRNRFPGADVRQVLLRVAR